MAVETMFGGGLGEMVTCGIFVYYICVFRGCRLKRPVCVVQYAE